jgi:hypothetical protein
MPYVAARDGRHHRGPTDRAPAVPDRLDDLHGHSVGVIELPHHMAAGHRNRRILDLEDPAQQRIAYQTVLCQAADCCEITDLLHPGVLRRLWRHLHLPDRVRQAWEGRHPVLTRPEKATATARVAAADLAGARMIAAVPPDTTFPAGRLTGRQMIAARTASSR